MPFLLSTSAQTFYPYSTEHQIEVLVKCGRRILQLHLKFSKVCSGYILQDIGAHSVVTDTVLEGHHLCTTSTIISQSTYVHEIQTQNTVHRQAEFLKCLCNNALVSELIIFISSSGSSLIYKWSFPFTLLNSFFCCILADFLVKIRNSILIRKRCRCIGKKRKTMPLISEFFVFYGSTLKLVMGKVLIISPIQK